MSEYTNNLFAWTSENNAWVILYNFIPEKSRVLDVGCSSGNFGEVLINEKKCTVVGLDIDEGDIKIAKKKLNEAYVLNIEQDDLSKLGTFDAIVFADVLEHLMNPSTSLEKVKKLLKPGGKILFSLPNMSHVSTRLRLIEGSFDYTPTGILDRTHLHYYDQTEVDQVFSNARLKIQEIMPTTITFTEKMIEDRLSKVGLKASKAFHEHLNRTKGDVYQFVGYATPTTKSVSNKNPKYTYPLDDVKEEMQRTARLAQDHDRNLRAMIAQRDEEIKQLTTDLARLKASKSWKVAKKLGAIKRKIRP